MNKEQITSEIRDRIEELRKLTEGMHIMALITKEVEETQYLLSKTFASIDKITGINQHYLREVEHCIRCSKRNVGIAVENIKQLIGQLRFIKDAIEND